MPKRKALHQRERGQAAQHTKGAGQQVPAHAEVRTCQESSSRLTFYVRSLFDVIVLYFDVIVFLFLMFLSFTTQRSTTRLHDNDNDKAAGRS